MKKCPTCQEEKDRSEFAKHSKRYDGLQAICKQCKKARDAVYFQANKEKILNQRAQNRDKSTARRYGITVEELLVLKSKHEGLCHICRKVEGEFVDHCHINLSVRGWLCRGCNSGLGFFRDNPEALQNAIEYLLLTGQTGKVT